jgi:hypothetical protein
MKERPIIFSGPMVRAILEGRKTQTRRVIKPQPPQEYDVAIESEGHPGEWLFWIDDYADTMTVHWPDKPIKCPYGQPGETRLWVRETWCPVAGGPLMVQPAIAYKADCSMTPVDNLQDGWTVYNADLPELWKWRPSIFMPRWASRITLELTGVRAERVQDISNDDAWCEGACNSPEYNCRAYFKELWDSINAKRKPRHIRRRPPKGKPIDQYEEKHYAQREPSPYSWDANPWVFVLEFKRV